MTTVFMTIAILCGIAGALMLSTATMGVGVICLGCLAGILARLNQAHYNHKKFMKAIRTAQGNGPTIEPSKGLIQDLGKLFG